MLCNRRVAAEVDHLRRALRRRGMTAADADDIIQEVFLVVCRRWGDYDSERPLRPWLAGIAARVASDHRRRLGRERPLGLMDLLDESPDVEEDLGRQRNQALVMRALAELPERQRLLITMVDVDGLPVRDVAEALSLRLFTVYAQLRRARRALIQAIRRRQLPRRSVRPAEQDAVRD